MRCGALSPATVLAASLLAGACGGGRSGDAIGDAGALSGRVTLDGSSTVFPIAEAVAEEFQIANPGVQVTVGISGTGGGFKRFCNAETDLSNASRPISASEAAACAAAGIGFTELPIARDGLSVIVNAANDFVACLTVDELRRIWEPGSLVRTWRDVRGDWPAQPIRLYGPGTASGTFDYFTEAIVGQAGASRPDYQASEDDNILVQGVSGDLYSLGYFGFAYVRENAERLKLVAVDAGAGCVTPSETTVADGSYVPLSRFLLTYVSHAAASRPEVRAFVEYLVENASEVVPSTGYLALSPDEYTADLAKLAGLSNPGGE